MGYNLKNTIKSMMKFSKMVKFETLAFECEILFWFQCLKKFGELKFCPPVTFATQFFNFLNVKTTVQPARTLNLAARSCLLANG